jgi:hypothetical protein
MKPTYVPVTPAVLRWAMEESAVDPSELAERAKTEPSTVPGARQLMSGQIADRAKLDLSVLALIGREIRELKRNRLGASAVSASMMLLCLSSLAICEIRR